MRTKLILRLKLKVKLKPNLGLHQPCKPTHHKSGHTLFARTLQLVNIRIPTLTTVKSSRARRVINQRKRDVYVRVRRFLGPHLQKLNVSFQGWCFQRLLPIDWALTTFSQTLLALMCNPLSIPGARSCLGCLQKRNSCLGYRPCARVMSNQAKSRLSRCTTEASISQDRLSTRSSCYMRSLSV